jgi:hypothetical protein
MTTLTLRRARANRPGHWQDDDYDVLDGERVIGRILKGIGNVAADAPWIWSITCIWPSPMANRGHASDLEAAKVAFKARWEAIHAEG